MIGSMLSRLLPVPESPTADLYFANACRDFFGAGVRRLAPTVFASASACLVLRHGLGAAALPRGRRLIYLVDDHVEDGVGDASLPFLYRQKLRFVERAAGRRIGPQAAAVVVSSPGLLPHPGLHQGSPGRVRLLHPYWSEPIAGLEHFAPLLRGEGWIEIAFLGSSVHRVDLDFLWPVIEALLAAEPRARFHLPSRHRVPPALAGHPRLLRIPAAGWPIYRAGLAGRRYHLALYPLLETPFNRVRSVNKLIEHAVVGAGGLYSRIWIEAWRAGDCGAGLLLDNRRADWLAAIAALVEQPQRLFWLAAEGAALARRLNSPGPQRRLWAELMGMDARAAA